MSFLVGLCLVYGLDVSSFVLGVSFIPCENNGITLTPQFLERLVEREI